MKKCVLLLGVLGMGVCGTLFAAPLDSPAKITPDPITKVLYYLESDGSHLAAISPDGKLLWCCELIPASRKKDTNNYIHIQNLDAASNPLEITGFIKVKPGIGGYWVNINKKTGDLEIGAVE